MQIVHRAMGYWKRRGATRPRYALALAETIGLPSGLKRQLSLSAKLHDIGKVAVPEAVLNKPGRLTSEEEAIIRFAEYVREVDDHPDYERALREIRDLIRAQD